MNIDNLVDSMKDLMEQITAGKVSTDITDITVYHISTLCLKNHFYTL